MSNFSAQLAATATTSVPPWWGVPVVAGVFLIVGILLTMLQSRAADARAAKREDAMRWMRDLRDISAEFLAAIHLLDSQSNSLRRSSRTVSDEQHATSKEVKAYKELSDSLISVSRTAVLISIIAPAKLAHEGLELSGLANRTAVAAATAESDFDAMSKQLKEGVSDFIQSVRAHLLVPGPERRRDRRR